MLSREDRSRRTPFQESEAGESRERTGIRQHKQLEATCHKARFLSLYHTETHSNHVLKVARRTEDGQAFVALRNKVWEGTGKWCRSDG